jgi:nitric oxide reductase NorQ protein
MSAKTTWKANRSAILAEIRALPGWQDYREANGIRSNNMSIGETQAACAALGYDLAGALTRFAIKSAGPGTGTGAEGPGLMAVDVEIEAMIAKGEEEGAEEAEGDAEGLAEASASASAEGAEGYEGRDAGDVLAEALAPASVHITPHLAHLLPQLLSPLAAAAVAGPRVIVRNVGHAAPGSPGVVDVRPVSRPAVWNTFGLRKGGQASPWRRALENPCNVCNYSQAPRVDHDYVWDPKVLAKLAACDSQGLYPWIYGPAGTGKTESIEQYAARLRRPFFRLALNRNSEPVDIVGQMVPSKGGDMRWADGMLLRAIRVPYAIVLIDEPSLLRPGSLAAFQTILDTRRLQVQATGEEIEVAQGVFVVAADNTAGAGDPTERYIDTAPMNAAFMSRFALKIPYDYLPAKQEAAMLSRRSGLPVSATTIMVDYAGLTRAKATAGELTMAVGTRELISWARAVKAGLPSAMVFDDAVINGAVPEDREMLIGLATTSLTTGHDAIDAIANGGQAPAPAAPAPAAPAPSPAGRTFADDQTL